MMKAATTKAGQQQQHHRPGATGTGTGTGVAFSATGRGSMGMMSPLVGLHRQQQQDDHPPNNMLSAFFSRSGNGNESHDEHKQSTENDTQALLAAELNRLSMKERDEVFQDIHGCSETIMASTGGGNGKGNGNESSDDDENYDAIGRFLEHLQTIPDGEKRAYLLAVEQDRNKKSLSSSSSSSSSYVHDPKFILMFLRCEHFNVVDAAKRFVMFFEQKLTLFGPEKLARDIWWSDLSDDDKSCLESGYVQVLSKRDRAGRAIIWFNFRIDFHKEEHHDSSVTENKMRAVYMVTMFALKDVQTQKNGFVNCVYNLGQGMKPEFELGLLKLANLDLTLPCRFSAVHYAYDDDKLKMIFGLAVKVFNKNTRLRCRLHYGTSQECIYNIMSFGIPDYIMPVTSTGEHRLENHKDFIRTIRWADREQKTMNENGQDHDRDSNEEVVARLVLPNNIDVLLGRGRPLQKHYGNLNYHFLVEEYQAEHERSTKSEKTMMVKTILDKIRKYGGRFLKQDDVGFWVEIDDDTARAKISQTFRNHRCVARATLKKKKKAVAGAEASDAQVATASSSAPVGVYQTDSSSVSRGSLIDIDVEEENNCHQRRQDRRLALAHDVAATSGVYSDAFLQPYTGSVLASTTTCTDISIGKSNSHQHQQNQHQHQYQHQCDPFDAIVDDLFSQQKRRRFNNNID
mmetsp:Transcript_35127/g.85000  ORF Transcript_35127/g.85000 Transcript_35127/m.85000 type:complete len:685 (+) Transcript_35127:147-2201(+)|eukprot:CAMPEP_0113477606 /NCGR_PEP_ID=MMETSP0014_2-20120614/20295_1 /TAXON_ID=2857 /ORGANISM="Nitzschia sp." /LENGTH=684 /DNA_ID=CAMNT_0000370707 /DNA_START=66 /DNA_END=2120 /DNA_ORIENTATION=- /assembly_acc=CAM_ASM_000159